MPLSSFRLRSLSAAVAALLVAASAALASSATDLSGQAPSCELFKQRLAGAQATLGLDLPAAVFEPGREAGETARWYVNNLAGHAGVLECTKAGRFVRFQIDAMMEPDEIDDSDRVVPTVDIVAAALHAYTGASALEALAARDVLIDKAWHESRRAASAGEPSWDAELALAGTATARLSGGEGLMFVLAADAER